MMSSVILLAMQMILLSTLNVTEQLQQLELASELQSNLQDTIDQGFPSRESLTSQTFAHPSTRNNSPSNSPPSNFYFPH